MFPCYSWWGLSIADFSAVGKAKVAAINAAILNILPEPV